MMVAIRFTRRAELKAIPILYRHSPGMILRDRTYIISVEAAQALRDAGVTFRLLTPTGCPVIARGATPGMSQGRVL